MKVKVLSLLVPALLVAGAANAAEIYNKDGNKLDLYGKIDGLHYFSDDKSVDGDQTYMRVGVKGENPDQRPADRLRPVGIQRSGEQH
ncbi:outer membrane protein C [Klebsiella pneumoniae subsp. ozaenae]|uniref:Outer membrane protein C n=1 Tax=Klebsiella pneumoniae subsp. ozaenae TaxID=574 RepID=A0A377ZA07_KLEPO|nr:outer membrane protein C [Klebsiella pneumoniae subsp. ozaenae]